MDIAITLRRKRLDLQNAKNEIQETKTLSFCSSLGIY